MNEAYEKFKRLLESSTYNIAQSYYDEFVETNCEMKARAGINQMIIRRQLGRCCDWCAALAGSYSIEEAPADIYKRHRNCRCLVTSKNADGYTDVWSKKKFEKQREARLTREQELLDSFRRQNNPKVTAERLDNILQQKYYNSPAEIKKLRETFLRDAEDGWFNVSIGFENYLADYIRIEEELVGLYTTNGIKINSQSEHFLARIYGTMHDPEKGHLRNGVSIDDAKQAILKGNLVDVRKNGMGGSHKFEYKGVEITVNPITGNLIQCNPA